MEALKKVCIIGAGNVATHLAKALAEVSEVIQIFSRQLASAQHLALSVGSDCRAETDLSRLRNDADFYIIAVNDDAITQIVSLTPDFPGIWAHTSGSIGAEVFIGKKSRFGVFYPLQTFSRNLEVDMVSVPFFIEGNSADVQTSLVSLANLISQNVRVANSDLRRQLHVAAVFACNFANLMWMEADEILRKCDLDVTFMIPLIKATLNKLSVISPREALTGPARRGDIKVINKHTTLLSHHSSEIYKILSTEILKEFHPDLVHLINADNIDNNHA